MNTILLFIILSVANVVTSTIKSIATIKSGKYMASLINALYYGYYTFVCVLTVTLDFALWQKAFITFACNLIGVFIVKLSEEKMRKDSLWKVEASVLEGYADKVKTLLSNADISFNYIEGIGKYVIFNIFCPTQKQSLAVKEILKTYKVKYFVTESKIL